MKLLLTILVTMAALQGAADARAEDAYFETLVKLESPKKASKRSQEGGLEHIVFRLWAPDGVERIRGVVLNPLYTKAVTQKHWQAAARHWGFGIVGANVFGAKPHELGQVVDQALATFAQQSDHPELKRTSMCLVGMSAGAGACTRIAEQLPERTIAMGPVCLEVGPRGSQSMGIPTITIFGERDGKQYEKLTAKLPEVRQQGGQFAIAVQWRRRHEFGQANNLLLPLFDAAIRQRLGDSGQPLKTVDEQAGWLGDLSNWRENRVTIAKYRQFHADRQRACWFPDAKTAHAWQAFVTRESKLKIKNPPGLGDDQPLVVHQVGQQVDIQFAGAPENVDQLSVYAGSVKLGDAEVSKGSGKLAIQFAYRGIYPLYVQVKLPSGEIVRSRPNTVIVN